MDQQTCQGDERWIRMVLPVTQLLFVKSFIVLRTRVAQSIMVGMISLDQNSSRTITTSGTASNLRNQLKRSFRGSEIRQRKPGIDRHHTDKRHIRKVVSLGQHLRADQGVDAAGTEVRECLFKHFTPRGGITINPRDTQGREEQLQHLLELFRALADVVDVLLPA